MGVPDAKYGEELCAWVILRDGAATGSDSENKEGPVTEESIKDYCRGQISHFKIPRYIRFVEDFPFTISGKVKKFEIRETMIRELGLEE